MLKSCTWCGSIHDNKYECPKKPQKKQVVTHKDKFRWTAAWQNKRQYIREIRDHHMCQICFRNRYYTDKQYNVKDIQVHHIDSIEEAWDKRLDDNNLISLCPYHHSMAEHGDISKDELLDIVNEQECKNSKN